MVRQRLRIETKGLAKEHTSSAIIVLRVIFGLVTFSVAAAGLIGVIIFFFVHRTSFS
ncbi:MAG TPA: hypothetical protein VEL47_05970 [Myxococcota bacterium]|nr:hypothetical protein [Myxococcota bacterium]